MMENGRRRLRRLVAPLERRICADRDAQIKALEARLDHERLFPAEWANRRVRDRFGDRVQAGPFKGLEYPDWGITHVDLFAPKLIGSYELELHDAVEAAITAEPSRVVNIGAAEGHYAVGLAMRVPKARVVAFEAQTSQHALLAEIAERNGVRDRIEIMGVCDSESLQKSLAPGALIVSDCDGGERELLDPQKVPQLTSCAMLVETHDLLVEGVTETLRERFSASHDIAEIPTRPRYVDDFSELGDIPLVTRQLAISEFRGAPMAWLVMRPFTA